MAIVFAVSLIVALWFAGTYAWAYRRGTRAKTMHQYSDSTKAVRVSLGMGAFFLAVAFASFITLLGLHWSATVGAVLIGIIGVGFVLKLINTK